MTGQRQFEAAAEAEAVDGRDHGHGQRLDAVEQAVDLRDRLDGVLLGGDGFELAHVGAGDEAGGLAGDEDEALELRREAGPCGGLSLARALAAFDIGLGERLDPLDDRVQLLQHAPPERVGAFALAVEDGPGDALDVDGEVPVFEGEIGRLSSLVRWSLVQWACVR